MPDCKVKIHDKGTPPAVIDLLKPDYKQGTLDTCVIMEGGMVSGKTSITLHIIDQDGKSIIVQTSAAIMEMIQGCIRGAEIRWAENRAKKN
jgi:C4-type Zn-finger protein